MRKLFEHTLQQLLLVLRAQLKCCQCRYSDSGESTVVGIELSVRMVD